MNMVVVTLSLFLALVATPLPVNGLSSGAPAAACTSLTQQHPPNSAQTSALPYTIEMSVFEDGDGNFSYCPGMSYQLLLSAGGGVQFRGFLIQARLMSDDTTVVGSFSSPPTGTRLSSCTPSESTITHNSASDKSSITVTWTAPPSGTGAVRLGYAVTQVYATFWANQRTDVIQEAAITPPSGMPQNLTIVVRGPRTISFSWEPPLEDQRNGIIIGYELTCDTRPEFFPVIYNQSSFSPSGGINVTLDGFSPATLVICCVRAATTSGNGPIAEEIVETFEDVPGPVQGVQVTSLSSSAVELTWSDPNVTNGVIRGYSVTVRIRNLNGSVVYMTQTLQRNVTATGLQPFVPHVAIIVANTSAGYGESTIAIFFSQAVAPPSGMPQNLTIVVEGPRTISFSWEPPLEEQRNGIIIGYELTCDTRPEFFPVIYNQSSFSLSGGINVTLDGFSPATLVICCVRAATTAGNGPIAEEIVETFEDVPGPVQGIQVTSLSSSAVELTWSDPNVTNGVIRGYDVTVRSRNLNGSVVYMTQTLQRNVVATGLQPFVPHVAIIVANTSAGYGEPTIYIFFTQAITPPSGMPQNLTIVAKGPRTISFSWEPPLESQRNGIIIGYELTCDTRPEFFPVIYNQSSFSLSGGINVTLDGFSPATLVICCVRAATTAGNGPIAQEIVETFDDVPGPVQGIQVTSLSSSAVEITWSDPDVTNGVIRGYSVTVRIRNLNSRVVYMTQTLQRNVAATGLQPLVPHVATIVANTSAGYGEPTSVIVFSQEGVPRGPPINVEVVRLNGTHMSVSWMLLRLEIARGIPSNYTITYSPIVAAMKRQAMSVIVSGDMNSVVIGGLSVAKQYSVSVSASTSAGPGPFSAAETASTTSSSLFQLVLQGVRNCDQWVLTDANAKVADIAAALQDGVVQQCQCMFTSEYVTNGGFQCLGDPNEATFRAQIYGTGTHNSSVLLTHVMNWLSTTQTVVVQSLILTINNTCPLNIDSLDAQGCVLTTQSPTTNRGPGDSMAAITEGIVGACVAGVTIIAVAIVIIVIIVAVLRSRRGEHKFSSPQHELKEQRSSMDSYAPYSGMPTIDNSEPVAYAVTRQAELMDYEIPDTCRTGFTVTNPSTEAPALPPDHPKAPMEEEDGLYVIESILI